MFKVITITREPLTQNSLLLQKLSFTIDKISDFKGGADDCKSLVDTWAREIVQNEE
jgi:hypothetical protein